MAPVTPTTRPTTTPTTTPVTTTTTPRTDPASTPRTNTRPATADTFETTSTTRPTNAPVLAPTPTPTPAVVDHSRKGPPERNGFPWISQLAPEGEVEVANAEVNCAPAVFAMVARKLGFGAELDDAQLVQKLAQIGGTKPVTGTSMNGVVAMARAIGLPVDQTEAKFPGFDQAWLDSQLAQGKSVVANGAMETSSGPSGHYILVTGKNASNGKYRINDPWNESRKELTGTELNDFLKRNPVHKGASVALG